MPSVTTPFPYKHDDQMPCSSFFITSAHCLRHLLQTECPSTLYHNVYHDPLVVDKPGAKSQPCDFSEVSKPLGASVASFKVGNKTIIHGVIFRLM